jgi:hypothetical protein
MFRRVSTFAFLLMQVVAATFAQNNRSAVSVNGSDANACTTVEPCRSFGVAISKTRALSDIGTDAVNADLTLENCTIAHNSGAGVQSSASGGGNMARVYLSQNLIAYNQLGVQKLNSGAVYSFANNRFVSNSSDGGPCSAAAFE